MKKIFLFLGILVAATQFSKAQGTVHAACESQVVGYTETRNPILASVLSEFRSSNSATQNLALSNAKGSPYLAQSFEKSKLYYGTELVGTFYARYNVYAQEIELKKTNSDQEQPKMLLKDSAVRLVFDSNKEIQFLAFIDDKGKRQEDYLVAKRIGDYYSLYERFNVNFKEGKPSENSFVAAVAPRFNQSSKYYIMNSNTQLVSYLPTKKSKLLNLFKGSEKVQLATMLKKKSFNLKNADDIIAIFDFMNTTGNNYVLQD